MSSLVTFTSSVYVDDATTTSSRFTSFSLDSTAGQSLDDVQNLIDQDRGARLLFRGPNLLGMVDTIRDVECRGLIGPRANQAGRREAVTRVGELFTLAYTLGDGAARSEVGIITNLTVTVRQGKHGQELAFVFHPVNRLRFLNSDSYLSDADYN